MTPTLIRSFRHSGERRNPGAPESGWAPTPACAGVTMKGSVGTTLIELIVGVVAAAILALATAALVKAGISTYTYCMRQNRMLEAARKSLVYGDAGRKGIVWGSQIGSVVNGVQGSSVTVVSNSGALYWTYDVSNNALQLHSGSATNSLATYISTVSYSYYNITDTGLIMAS